MRRADRLFQILQLLRRRRVATAAWLAERLGVSERTVYRDIDELIVSGVPVSGAAGFGYKLHAGFELPPLMFTEDEVEALVLGLRVVESWADRDLAEAAKDAHAKIEAVLPERLKPRLKRAALFSPPPRAARLPTSLASLRRAIRERHKIRFTYERADATRSERTVRPLCLTFVPPLWLLSAWCELRGGFRTFRTDRLSGLQLLADTFTEERGRTLGDFLRVVVGLSEEELSA